MTKIGYQGIEGSNSHVASRNMAITCSLKAPEYVPLVSSENVISSLKQGKIDYGVVATRNTLGGRVEETFKAIRNRKLELVTTDVLAIHHNLYKLPQTKVEDLTEVASHIQALKQTENSRKLKYPNLKPKEVKDTALAAEMLKNGKLSPNTAVLCRDIAGELNELELVEANLEDDDSNRTEFRMFELPSIDYDNREKPSIKDLLIYSCVTQSGIGRLGQLILILGIFGAVFLAGGSFFESMDLATAIAGLVSALLLFLTSDHLKSLVQYRLLKGYWKYYSIPDEGREGEIDLAYEVPRIVIIDDVDGELKFRGWKCDEDERPFFEANKIMISSPNKSTGTLAYWYSVPQMAGTDNPIRGFADLNWEKKHPASKVNFMSGRYASSIGQKETGTVEFQRITMQEFERHKACTFLGC